MTLKTRLKIFKVSNRPHKNAIKNKVIDCETSECEVESILFEVRERRESRAECVWFC